MWQHEIRVGQTGFSFFRNADAGTDFEIEHFWAEGSVTYYATMLDIGPRECGNAPERKRGDPFCLRRRDHVGEHRFAQGIVLEPGESVRFEFPIELWAGKE